MKKKPDYPKIVATTVVIAPMLWFLSFALVYFGGYIAILPIAAFVTGAGTVVAMTLYVKWAAGYAAFLKTELSQPKGPPDQLPPASPWHRPKSEIAPWNIEALMVTGLILSIIIWVASFYVSVKFTGSDDISVKCANFLATLSFVTMIVGAGWVQEAHLFFRVVPSLHDLWHPKEEENNYLRMVTCEHCGSTSILASQYKPHKFFWQIKGNEKILCPRCLSVCREMIISPLVIFPIIICYSLLAIAMVWDMDESWLWMNLLAMCLCLYPAILLHELGHAMVGKLLGMQILEVQLGSGKRLWSGKLFNQYTTINFPSLASNVKWSDYYLDNLEKKQLWFTLAGPLTNLLIATILLMVLNPTNVVHSFLYTKMAIIPSFIVANFLMSGFSVDDFQTIIYRLIYPGKLSITNLSMGFYEKTFGSSMGLGTRDADIYRQVSPYSPGKSFSIWRGGLIYGFLGEWERAKKSFFRLLEMNSPEPEENAWAKQSFAYFIYLNNDTAHFSYAGQYARDAFVTLPWEPLMMATMGRALVSEGEYDKGWPLIKRAYFQAKDKPVQGEIAAMMACVLKEKGKLDLAEQWLETAENTYPGLMSVQVIKMELALAA